MVLVANSNIKHSLSGSEYPIRVQQCKEALQSIKRLFPEVTSLRDATIEMLNAVQANEDVKMNEISYRRARHCVSENERTLAAVAALKTGDFDTVGKAMTASHYSLKNDYEVCDARIDIRVRAEAC